MSTNQLGGIKELEFMHMPAPSVEDGRGLGRCLHLSINLTKLFFSGVGMSDGAFGGLLSSLGKGALPQLMELSLGDNKIGDEGMKTFSMALASGAVAQLTVLKLFGNKI
eukprot:3612703-Prymnesium_polylepis.1